ncbi:MAG TPA: YebC/PmpR family DNA-binding transcriptional regulator [Verrucomicrobia bacterium]|nr:MAG: transcriptional regulator [Lentisphaerae bacterium GWF2_57_35]HBA86085.1 YebC/PmpR family DNA-binding transcriptional regulator [Verrucomicrobiota bacterium]
MSGHSKWATIKHKKAATDAKKGKVFSKLAKEIMICARAGGGDPGANISLRTMLQKAKQVNMPSDNIDRAIKKGTGELQSAALEEIMFEAYASGGVGLIVQCLSDNRNRTVAEVRHVITRCGGNLAGQGQVMRSFTRKGQIIIDATKIEEDKLMELVLEAGADDMQKEDDKFEVLTDPSKFNNVVEALSKAGIQMESSEVSLIPDTYTPVTDKDKAGTLVKFIEELEDLDDVQNVYTNADIDDSLLA